MSVCFLKEVITGIPNEIEGTNTPSITSICKYCAPASCTSFICFPNCQKSAAKIEGDKMFATYYCSHFVNGQNMTVAEYREEKEYSPELIERFNSALPDKLLVIGNEDEEVTYIPAGNILYISIIPEDLL